ncbi:MULTISPECIES: glycosyltransferase family 4 protein [Okeania]|uniref:glycosyltransferase family 4 protein n=1 Tax=Okeania TaxID=1458928 RepID=UPI000F52B451|nr:MULTISPECIES: glycosyltransferase family 4 protein [Okeania]NET13481.1 glycosyltransferase family 4 protein [Okeania sp. SIO1H6]NES78855.1 glycosyltransferase family 4 protein [Okeania sp. SIO1H4]NET22829.1 glycosyltransferase family 4 protein [Okeania sp. SIO1H5]NET77206.1 glycosyltransferase family 4 protein [Okeania sp. SIO1F9]NET95788.1 glycosyltransferase family 4 protein [Okeania sp. SIO1H2]
MKIAYSTTYDVHNPASWPSNKKGNYGSNSYIAKTLESQDITVNYLGPLEKHYSWVTRSKWLLYSKVFKQDYYRWADPIICRDYAYQVARKLSILKSDIVLATEGVQTVAYLKCQQPIVLWLDTLTIALVDYYPALSNICQETRKSIYNIEKAAIDKCKLLIFTSDWAAENAVKHYQVNESKIYVIPRGANIELKPGRTFEEVENIVKSRKEKPCKLIFSGIDWDRKGGDIAVGVVKQLNEMGFNAELTIIGCKPEIKPLPDFINIVGYIDKSKPEGESKMRQLVADSHLMILPTREDCAPNVLIEANAFGVPCLTTNLAGIPTVIKEDINGKTFAFDAEIKEYCDYIISRMSDYPRYQKLAMSSFKEYQQRLNWDVVGKTAKQLFMDLL